PLCSSHHPTTTPSSPLSLHDALPISLLSPDGEARRVLGVATDITERKRAEEALRRSEASYRGLVEHAAYGIYRATTDGKFLMVRSEEHTSELQSRFDLVCRLLLEKKK